MANDSFAAVLLLQQRSFKCFNSSPYWTERIDRALDDTIRNIHRTGNPSHLVRNALSDAGKVLSRRNDICRFKDVQNAEDDSNESSVETIADPRTQGIEAAFMIRDWVDRTSLSDTDRNTLILLIDGSEADEIAGSLGLTVQQARVQISRARKRAKAQWEADTNV